MRASRRSNRPTPEPPMVKTLAINLAVTVAALYVFSYLTKPKSA